MNSDSPYIEYENLSDAEIDRARTMLEVKSNVLALSTLVILLGFFCAAIYFGTLLKIYSGAISAIFAVSAIFMVGVGLSMFCAMHSFSLAHLKMKLSPANTADNRSCADAWRMVEKSPKAKALVTRTNALGRQLRVFDIEQIRKLYSDDQGTSPVEENKQACRQLHNI